jgi:hypothetical protein
MDARDSGLSASPKYGYFVVGLYNGHRSHSGLKGKTPIETFESKGASLRSYLWRQHCRGPIKHRSRREEEFAMHRFAAN